MSTYTTRIFPGDRRTKADARRECQAIADEARTVGLFVSSWQVRATSQHGRPCITVQSSRAAEHRRLVAWTERRIPGLIVASHNAAAARALGTAGG